MDSHFVPNQTVCLKQSADYICGNKSILLFAYYGKSWFVSNISGVRKRVSTEEARLFAKKYSSEESYNYSLYRK